MELFDYRDYLEYRHEYQLNTAPLQIDLLIIKKLRDIVIDKNIARIFRTDNVVEYKSPEDYLSVKDFWKVCAYANLYAATTPGVDLADVTLTFIGSRHPRKLLRYLTSTRGCTVEETSPGIYLVSGDYIPIQIIESQKLSEAENLWLNSLREGLKESSLDAIYEEEGKKQGQEISIDAYMDVLLRANQKTLKEAYNMRAPSLETILTEIGFVPEMIERGRVQGLVQGREQGLEQGRVQGLEQGRVQGLEQGRVQGREQGKAEVVRNLLRMGMSVEEIAQAVELPVEKIRSLV
jgi:hypothetical protein